MGFRNKPGMRIRGGFSREHQRPEAFLPLFLPRGIRRGQAEIPDVRPRGRRVSTSSTCAARRTVPGLPGRSERHVHRRNVRARHAGRAWASPTRAAITITSTSTAYTGASTTRRNGPKPISPRAISAATRRITTSSASSTAPSTSSPADGDLDAWLRLWQAATNGFASDANYERVQGNNPDGTPNPAYEVLVDMDNLIDYMLLTFYVGNFDGPVYQNSFPNNFFASRNRNTREGFRFFTHDAELSLSDVNFDRTGTLPWATGGGQPLQREQSAIHVAAAPGERGVPAARGGSCAETFLQRRRAHAGGLPGTLRGAARTRSVARHGRRIGALG